MLDGAGRDSRKKCLLVLLSLEARFEITDFLLQPLLADILERPIAENSLDVVTAIVTCSFVEVIAKLHHAALAVPVVGDCAAAVRDDDLELGKILKDARA